MELRVKDLLTKIGELVVCNDLLEAQNAQLRAALLAAAPEPEAEPEPDRRPPVP